MKPRNARTPVRAAAVLAVGSLLALGGCEDPINPIPWINFPDTAELYSLARAEYVDRPGAYDFLQRGGSVRVVESLALPPFTFDIAFSEDEEGGFVLLPTGFFPDATARSGILIDDTASFDGLRRAPSGDYTVEEPVPAQAGVIYVVRSRQAGNGCRNYGKMEILDLGADGIMRIRTLINPNCGDRSLVPNTELEEEEDETEGEGEA